MAEITMPKMSDTMEEGRVIRWIKHEGEQVTEGEPIAEIETDKANVEMEAFEPGVIKQIMVQEGETVPVGTPIATLEAPETAGAPAAPPERAPTAETEAVPVPKAPEPYTAEQKPLLTAAPPPEAAAPAPEEERVKASPLARRMAEEHDIDIGEVQGTGPGGRVVEADIEDYLKQAEAAAAPPPAPAPPAAPKAAPAEMKVPTEERELSKMRKTIAHRMTQSKQTIPHFYLSTEIEMDWASRVRDELNSSDEVQPKVSFTDLAIKAAALALKQFPEANASYSDDKLLLHKEINIGMAVALEDGLIAPVIHNADQKSLREIAAETKELAERARAGNLRATDYTGGTFTVSNLGMFDVESFAAIINPPECASLAIGTVVDRPVVVNKQVAVAKRVVATMSGDHRVLDGAVAARFLQEFKRGLEMPLSLL